MQESTEVMKTNNDIQPKRDLKRRWPILVGASSILFCAGLLGFFQLLIVHEDYLTIDFVRRKTGWPEVILLLTQGVLAMLFAGAPWYLLDGAVGTLLRRKRAVGSYMGYAWISIVFVFVFTVIIMDQIIYIAPYHIRREPGLISKLIRTTIITDIFILSYPLFLLFWFSRKKIKEDIREWE